MALQDVERSQLGWWVVGAALLAVLAYVVYSFLGTFVFGVFLYYATRPIHRRIRRRVGPPSVAAAISIFLLALPALLLVIYALAVVVREAQRYLGEEQFTFDSAAFLPQELLDQIVGPESLVAADFQDLQEWLSSGGTDQIVTSLASAADSLAMVGIGLVHLFVMIALAFYLLRDDRRLSRWVLARFGDDRGVLEEFLRSVDNDFNSIFFGNILNAVLTGTIGVIAYSVLNVVAPAGNAVPTPALIGMLAGIASLIPVVGMKLVYFPVALFMTARAVLAGDPDALWFVATFAVISFVVVDTIPDLVLRPYVSGRSLHVGSLMIAYTFGPLLFGWYGIFLMPMLLVLVVHFARVVLPELLAPEPLRPYTVDPSYLLADEPPAEDVVDEDEPDAEKRETTLHRTESDEGGTPPTADPE